MNRKPVVHFEMPYKDAGRIAEFYTKAFGWSMLPMGEKMGNYVVAHTAETDEQNMVKTPGAINGGFFPIKPDWPDQVPSVVISVDDIKIAITDVKNAGGEVLGEPMDIPGIGQYVSVRDTEGNRLSLLQAKHS